MAETSPLEALRMLRALLLWILLAGFAGTGTELVLIGHDEDAWQWIPLAVLAVAMASTLGMIAARHKAAIAATRLFQGAMVLLMLSGALGAVLHFRAGAEFKREMDPSLSGLALFASVIRAKAPPALAPGTLALLGMIGLASAFRREAGDAAPNR